MKAGLRVINIKQFHLHVACDIYLSKAKNRVVQTKLNERSSEMFRNVTESKGQTIKAAAREAIMAWAAREGELKNNPLFDLSWVLDAGKRTDSSKVDEVIYSKRGIE